MAMVSCCVNSVRMLSAVAPSPRHCQGADRSECVWAYGRTGVWAYGRMGRIMEARSEDEKKNQNKSILKRKGEF